ncbi:MAG: XrtA system polysaccharide chain length determinant [Pseudomonadota bacterium]
MIDLSTLPTPIVKYGVGLWRRRWMAAACAWAFALIGWAAIWLIPDQYESRAQVFVQTETILDPVMNGVTARPNYERRVEVMRNQLLTRPNVEKIIFNTGLKDLVEGDTALARQAALQKLVDWVAGSIRIDSTQEMYFVIRYRFGEPQIARDVVNEVVNMLIEQDLGASLSESEDAKRRLQNEIDSYDARLTAKEQEIAAFRRQNAEELSMIEGQQLRRNDVEDDISRVREEGALAKRRLRTLETLLSTTPATTSGSELDRLLVQLAELRSQYEDTHPDIRNVQARIAELRAGSAALPDNPEYRRIANEISVAKDLVATLEARQQELIAEKETLAFTRGQAPAVFADLQRIERDYEQTKKSYEELLERNERLNLTESLSAGAKGVEYRVFERPQVAIRPAFPPRLILIVAVLLLAVGAGTTIATGLTFFDRSFTQVEELKTAFGLPVLGAMSEVATQDVKSLRRRGLFSLGATLAGLVMICGLYIYLEVFRLPGAAGVAQDLQNDFLRGAAGPQNASIANTTEPTAPEAQEDVQ